MAYDRNQPGTETSKVLTKTEAREGVTGHNVRYVLGWSLGGALVILAIVYFVFIH
jgi:hypothetical protein